MNRNFKGIWIPKEIWESEDLSLIEKVMLVEIDSLDDEINGCFATNKYFGDFFKLSNGRVSQIISDLSDKGYLDIEYIYNGKEIQERHIKIKRPPYPEVFNKLNTYLENDNRVFNKLKGGYLENDKDNNINNINNIDNNIKKKDKKKYFDDEEVNDLFIEFLNQRKKLKAVNSDLAINKLISKIKGLPKQVQIETINESIINSWKGLFPRYKAKENVPEWFDANIEDEQPSDEDLEEIKDFLKKM